MNHHTYYVYIMASKRNGTLYIGVTNDLIRRVYEHKNNLVEGFTNKFRVHKLVYWEQSENVDSALQREKQLKKWNRQWKLALIEEHNANWQDLYEQLLLATNRFPINTGSPIRSSITNVEDRRRG